MTDEEQNIERGVQLALGTEFRLPDGAQFSAVYNAERVEWNAQLIIPARIVGTGRIGELRFAKTGHGIFGTLANLDRQYRREMGLLPPAKHGRKGANKKPGAQKGKQL